MYNIVTKYVINIKPNPKLYEELKAKNNLFFDFQEKIDNKSYVSKLAQRLHYYPLEHTLNYKKIFEPYN